MKTLSRCSIAVAMFLLAAACAHPGMTTGSAPATQLTGTVRDLSTGRVVPDAYVYAYTETVTHFFGPPAYLSAATGPDGTYALNLPRGTYSIFVRKRSQGGYQGPLTKHDLFSDPSGERIKLGSKPVTLDLEVQKLEGQQLYRPERMMTTTGTILSGRVVDANGKPFAGAFVFAYRDRFEKGAPPDFGSPGTDASGKYRLYLEAGGRYIIGARVNIKDPPRTGEPVGFYRDDRQNGIELATGQTLEGIDIVVRPFEKGAP
jgi:hypothetical protein